MFIKIIFPSVLFFVLCFYIVFCLFFGGLFLGFFFFCFCGEIIFYFLVLFFGLFFQYFCFVSFVISNNKFESTKNKLNGLLSFVHGELCSRNIFVIFITQISFLYLLHSITNIFIIFIS